MTSTASLKEQSDAITNVAVSTARANLQTEFKFLDDRLSKNDMHAQGALLQMLGAAYQIREIEAKNAISEHQYKVTKQREADEAEKQKRLEAEQAEIAEANKPRLVNPVQ